MICDPITARAGERPSPFYALAFCYTSGDALGDLPPEQMRADQTIPEDHFFGGDPEAADAARAQRHGLCDYPSSLDHIARCEIHPDPIVYVRGAHPIAGVLEVFDAISAWVIEWSGLCALLYLSEAPEETRQVVLRYALRRAVEYVATREHTPRCGPARCATRALRPTSTEQPWAVGVAQTPAPVRLLVWPARCRLDRFDLILGAAAAGPFPPYVWDWRAVEELDGVEIAHNWLTALRPVPEGFPTVELVEQICEVDTPLRPTVVCRELGASRWWARCSERAGDLERCVDPVRAHDRATLDQIVFGRPAAAPLWPVLAAYTSRVGQPLRL